MGHVSITSFSLYATQGQHLGLYLGSFYCVTAQIAYIKAHVSPGCSTKSLALFKILEGAVNDFQLMACYQGLLQFGFRAKYVPVQR